MTGGRIADRCQALCLMLCLCSVATCRRPQSARVIYLNRLDSIDAILTRTGVTLETDRGKGRLRIDAIGSATIRLAQFRPNNASGGTLVYRGHLRSEGLKGRAYFEMRCNILGKGEYSAKGLEQSVTGSQGWVSQATPLLLDKGDRCETMKLNLIAEGTGVVWVGNIAVAEVMR
jgi:hypothetical protein